MSMPQLKKILGAATKIQCSQNKYYKQKPLFPELLELWVTVGLYVCQRLYVCMPGADSEMEIQLQATGSDQIRSDQSLSRV